MANPLTCPTCSEIVPSRSVNIDRMVAVCPACDTIFQFDGSGQASAYAPDAPPPFATTSLDKPKHKIRPRKIIPSDRLRVFDDTVTGGLEVHQHHRNSSMIFLTFFCVFWDGFLVMWYTIALNTGEWMMAAFASLHTLVGVVLTYWLLTMWFNKTRITITPEQIHVVTSPIFVHSPRTVEAAHIDQIFVKRTNHQTNGNYHYNVFARILGEGDKKLAGGFMQYEDAAFLEQEIENYLGIEHYPVAEETTKLSGYY